jgi:hypothetical protein
MDYLRYEKLLLDIQALQSNKYIVVVRVTFISYIYITEITNEIPQFQYLYAF